MDKGIAFLGVIKLWLEANLGLGSAFAVLCLAVFLFVYAFRKLLPNVWIWLVKRIPYIDFETEPVLAFLDKTLQTLPGAVFGAFLTWASTGGSLKAAMFGAISGPLMAVGHHILKSIPWIPYMGKLGQDANQRFTRPEGIRYR